MRRIICAFILSSLLSLNAIGQQFWLTTYEFPGGTKTSLARSGDSTLFVGTAAGIIRSFNQGYKFDTVLTRDNVFTLFVSSASTLYAGSAGKIYRSLNLGNTWDSTTLNLNFPVIKIMEKANGHLFAITGLSDNNGFTGAGVYFSDNGGNSWAQRNTGLGAYLCCDEITADKNGRLYVAVGDELATGNAGLFYSDNEGLLWNHVDITFDGKNAVADNLQLVKTTGLSVSPDDSLFISFEGIAVNTLVNLNLYKSIADVTGNSKWENLQLRTGPSWWNDAQLNTIHFAHNGDRYSSRKGTINTGGTYFCKNGTYNWHRHTEGLGLDMDGNFNYQLFTETSAGKVFMVQLLGELINVTDTSRYMPTSINEHIEDGGDINVYPNPATANATVIISFQNDDSERLVTLFDVAGRQISQLQTREKKLTLDTPLTKGIYVLQIIEGRKRSMRKIVVM